MARRVLSALCVLFFALSLGVSAFAGPGEQTGDVQATPTPCESCVPPDGGTNSVSGDVFDSLIVDGVLLIVSLP